MKEKLVPMHLLCICNQAQRRVLELRRLRYERANIPAHEGTAIKTFNNFYPEKSDHPASTGKALSTAQDFARGPSRPILTLSGVAGSGKSHLLEAIAREAMEGGQSVRYDMAVELVNRLRSASSTTSQHSFEEIYQEYLGVAILLIDDLGTREQKDTSFAIEHLTAIVDHRLRDGKRTVVATNLTPEPMGELWGFRLASRLFDRTTGGGQVVYLKCNDYRLKSKKGVP